MREDWHTHWHRFGARELIVKKEGGLAQGCHDIRLGSLCDPPLYMPPEMEAMADPDKPEFVYMPEFGHNLHQRRLLMV